MKTFLNTALIAICLLSACASAAVVGPVAQYNPSTKLVKPADLWEKNSAQILSGLQLSDAYQPTSVLLSNLVGIGLPSFTGSATFSWSDTTSYGRGLAGAADAAAIRTLVGAVIGTNVQQYRQPLTVAAAAGLDGVALTVASQRVVAAEVGIQLSSTWQLSLDSSVTKLGSSISLTSEVSGILPTTSGGTGATDFYDAIVTSASIGTTAFEDGLAWLPSDYSLASGAVASTQDIFVFDASAAEQSIGNLNDLVEPAMHRSWVLAAPATFEPVGTRSYYESWEYDEWVASNELATFSVNSSIKANDDAWYRVLAQVTVIMPEYNPSTSSYPVIWVDPLSTGVCYPAWGVDGGDNFVVILEGTPELVVESGSLALTRSWGDIAFDDAYLLTAPITLQAIQSPRSQDTALDDTAIALTGSERNAMASPFTVTFSYDLLVRGEGADGKVLRLSVGVYGAGDDASVVVNQYVVTREPTPP